MRRTKIIATLGPATSSPEIIGQLVDAGMNIARLNMSHASHDWVRATVKHLRAAAETRQRSIGILMDTQGPAIRTGDLKVPLDLKPGQKFAFTVRGEKSEEEHSVEVNYEHFVSDISVGDVVLLDNGEIQMKVLAKHRNKVECEVLTPGKLGSRRHINLPGVKVSLPALTAKDIADVALGLELGVDYLALSFVREAKDLRQLRALTEGSKHRPQIIAKIEDQQAVKNLEEIVSEADGIMVARGDLAVEVGNAAVPALQKRMIRMARAMDKVVITATQMMESMISSPMPTRAEVSDVANAAFDYTDAVMLSAESAAGAYPVEAVKAMARVCLGAEKHPINKVSRHRLEESFERCDESIALAAMYTANHFPGVKAIICLTESGYTPLIMSRIRSSMPIFAFSPHRETQARVALFRGVQTVPFDAAALPADKVSQAAIDELLKRGVVQQGDWVILTKGDSYHTIGGTNTMKILHVGDVMV